MPTFIYFPYFYFLKTRLKENKLRLSWLFVYFIPNLFIFLSQTKYELSLYNLSLMLVGFILVNYIYENGYIQNDIILTKKEENPTLRLPENLLIYFRLNIRKVFLYRIVISSLLLLFILLVGGEVLFFKYLAISFSIQILYIIYNSIRSLGNLLLIFPLSYLRFYGAIIPFVTNHNMIDFIIGTSFIYPFLKFLEFCTLPKYKLTYLAKKIGDLDVFRVKYYFFILFSSLLLTFFHSHYFTIVLVLVYYFFYRILTLLFTRLN